MNVFLLALLSSLSWLAFAQDSTVCTGTAVQHHHYWEALQHDRPLLGQSALWLRRYGQLFCLDSFYKGLAC